MILSKFDHCFSDGLGLIALQGFFGNYYSVENYPAIMRKKINKFVYYSKIIFDIIKTIFLLIINPMSLFSSKSKIKININRYFKKFP